MFTVAAADVICCVICFIYLFFFVILSFSTGWLNNKSYIKTWEIKWDSDRKDMIQLSQWLDWGTGYAGFPPLYRFTEKAYTG